MLKNSEMADGEDDEFSDDVNCDNEGGNVGNNHDNNRRMIRAHSDASFNGGAVGHARSEAAQNFSSTNSVPVRPNFP